MKTLPICITSEHAFAPLRDVWPSVLAAAEAAPIFLTWEWQELWWRSLGEGELEILVARAGDEVIGIAPLVHDARGWGFCGGAEVADDLDVIARRGAEGVVVATLLDYLQARGGRIHLRNLRPSSLVATHLVPEARRRGLAPRLEPEDVCPRVVLPETWEAYLGGLTKKDRHELRRKFRRLEAAGLVDVSTISPDQFSRSDLADFVRLHRLSGDAKAAFMTPAMERFFGAMLACFIPTGQARLTFLRVDEVRVAATISFDDGNAFQLYNSGYDPAYAHLSVGLLLKALCLREAIAQGRSVFDFLQGGEPYKYDLGAVDSPIDRLCLDLGACRPSAAGKQT